MSATPDQKAAPNLADKLSPRAEACARATALPQPVVFTNGVFDVLHRGHVQYLEQARALGGSLVVALNTDASAKRLGKGPDRPLNNEADRAAVIAALASVSLVTWFEEDTPLELIAELKPDVLVKGGDYDMAKLAETRVVEAYGGIVKPLTLVEGISTTRIVQGLRGEAPIPRPHLSLITSDGDSVATLLTERKAG